MPNVSIGELARLRGIEKELVELRDTQATEAFAKALGEAVATVLANTPWDKWPTIGKMAFDHLKRGQSSAAEFYKSRLPTD